MAQLVPKCTTAKRQLTKDGKNMLNVPVIKEILEVWRSGKVVQIRGKMNDRWGGRCAVGVMYDVVAKYQPMFELGAFIPPPEGEILASYLGLDEAVLTNIVHLNDHDMLSFEQIADQVEATLWLNGELPMEEPELEEELAVA